ncbi:hypothetical protein CPB85DRAFT_1284982, partial [Mucidula mucida]
MAITRVIVLATWRLVTHERRLLGKPNSELFCIIVHSDTDLIDWCTNEKTR